MWDQPLPIHGIHHPGDTRPAHPPDRVAPYVMREGIAYVGGVRRRQVSALGSRLHTAPAGRLSA